VRSAPERSAFPKTRRLARVEIERGQPPSNRNDSQGTKQSAGREGNPCAALEQASSADRTDVRAINVGPQRRPERRNKAAMLTTIGGRIEIIFLAKHFSSGNRHLRER